MSIYKTLFNCVFLMLVGLMASMPAYSQIKPKVQCVGGDNVPALKQNIEVRLETILLEINRINKGSGSLEALKTFFTEDAFKTLQNFVINNGAYTARKEYKPQMVEREKGAFYDIRSITMKVKLGETEASENQNIIFTFSKDGLITSVRAVLPNYDFQSVISSGLTEKDSLVRGIILDFIEQFRMAYNSKNLPFLEKVYSDEALIFVGSVIEEKKGGDDVFKHSNLSAQKVRLIQQTKRQYLDGLKEKAFKRNSFVNVKFEDLKILQHEKFSDIYGISCWQEWRSSNYGDRGYLFLMIDFRDKSTPVIHVRAWQPKAFEEDSQYVNLYDFDIVAY